jgi:DNA-3-methyladenine glycosylase II
VPETAETAERSEPSDAAGHTRPTGLDDFADGDGPDDGTGGDAAADDSGPDGPPADPYDHLRETDLAPLVDRYGELDLSTRGDPFERLVVSIVRQLISTERADRIVARLREAYEITPEAMLDADEDELRELGLSGRKIGYLRNAAEWWAGREPDREAFESMSDAAVVDWLGEISGVGDWTARMVLLLGLERPDVFPIGDYALRKGVERWTNGGEELSRDAIREAAEPWRPFRSYATLYVWWFYVDEQLGIEPGDLTL